VFVSGWFLIFFTLIIDLVFRSQDVGQQIFNAFQWFRDVFLFELAFPLVENVLDRVERSTVVRILGSSGQDIV
jgi:hypothetical protein